jgi:sensor histidine kinase YesM
VITAATMLMALLNGGPKTLKGMTWFAVTSFFFASVHGAFGWLIMPRIWPWTNGLQALLRWPVRFASLISISLIATPIAVALVFLVMNGDWSNYWNYYRNAQPSAIIVTIIVGGSTTIYGVLSHKIEQTTLELRTKQLEHERAMKLATEARLASLESRLHPHFLFNTINSISSLIREDPQRAERMLEQMAALLRFSLDAGQTPTVPLERELKMVRDYLEIEKARFGDRLQFDLDVPEYLNQWPTPPMSIQTLVENSIKHAIAPKRGGGRVQVSASNGNGRLRLEVTDDGPGFSGTAMKASHGLETLALRLETLYGPGSLPRFAKTDRGMSVILELPKERIAG